MRTKTSSASSRLARRRQANVAAMKRAKQLPRHLQRELRALEALPDDQIDTSDIPEITDAQWRNRKTGLFYRPVKKPITIRLDVDLVDWFKRQGRGHSRRVDWVFGGDFAGHREIISPSGFSLFRNSGFTAG